MRRSFAFLGAVSMVTFCIAHDGTTVLGYPGTDRGDRFHTEEGSELHFVQTFAFWYLQVSSIAHAVTIPEVDYVTAFAQQRFAVMPTHGELISDNAY
eukprot:118997-Rhodomonas_salina.1